MYKKARSQGVKWLLPPAPKSWTSSSLNCCPSPELMASFYCFCLHPLLFLLLLRIPRNQQSSLVSIGFPACLVVLKVNGVHLNYIVATQDKGRNLPGSHKPFRLLRSCSWTSRFPHVHPQKRGNNYISSYLFAQGLPSL